MSEERGRHVSEAHRPPTARLGSEALLTDLYQLTMLQGYFDHGLDDTAVFEFFVRRLPEERGFLLAAGLDQALEYLESLRFTDDDLDYLRASGRFRSDFLEHLAEMEFTGDVHAMPEGTPFFANEPILRVTAPLPEAQLVETRLVNLLSFQTLIASKAARCVLAAPGKQLVDFGFRRAHGAEAGLLAARASYLAGFDGTATVQAEKEFGIPAFGTMAHSFIQAHDSEIGAFEDFSRSFPESSVLLIDTYDTLEGARNVTRLAPRLAADGITVQAVRLDSGDMGQLSKDVRVILDEGGCPDVGIFCSGSLDEYEIANLLRGGAPIDGFGVGTRLDVSADAPSLDCVYKIQEYAGVARRKRSTGKATWPGRKQVLRELDDAGRIRADVIALEGEGAPGTPLLARVMSGGRRLEIPALEEARAYARLQLDTIPEPLRALDPTESFEAEVSAGVRELAAAVDRRFE